MRLGKDKQVKLLVVFLLLSASAGSQPGKMYKYRFNDDLQKANIVKSENSLTINYSISELNIESLVTENRPFYRIFIPGHTPTSVPGKPELPVLSRLIIVPENYTYKIKISKIKSTKLKPSGEKIEGVLFPAQEGETKVIQKKKPPFAIDKALYESRGFIPTDTVSIEPLGILRNKRLANIVITPVRYDPRSNLLEVITSMKIEIFFSQQGTAITKSLYPESALFTQSLGKGVLDYGQEELITGFSDKPVRMVIITDTTFLKDLQPFLRWKTQKGFKLDVLTRGVKSAGITYTEIKNTLSKIYNESSENDPPPEYLLIIGDVNKVPYYGSGNVTDMYYGEFDGNGDYIPEMFIGRLPVADTTELKSVVKKIIQYEKFEFADTNKFYSNALVTAGYDASYANFMNGQVGYAIKNYLTPVNNINEQHFYYFQNLSLPGALTARKDSIIKIINKGTSFINYTGHGDETGWLHLNIKVPDTSKLRNVNMYPFIISNACRTSEFNIGSFGNRMVLGKNKGAIGFIGCSNDSYWDEDFYWSVGTGTPSSNPSYEASGLGAYDRFFHTHNELPSAWHVTMGQINYAGNLSVSASTSTRKKYYWETYNLVGDPSMIPIIGTPQTFNVHLPDTLPNGMKSLSMSIEPFAYIAVSHFDTLWDASYASPSGSVVLDMPGLSNDSCLFVITGQNKIPIIKKVYFSKITDKFLNLTATSVNDSSANNNGLADFGETFNIAITVSNLGLSEATGVFAKLSTSSQWVTVNSDSVSIGTITAGSEAIAYDGLNITLSDTIPDKGILSFDLLIKDQVSEKHYTLDISVHAPELDIISCIIDDSQTGNKNFIADPGETVNFIFRVRNRGSSNIEGNLDVSGSENITILQQPIKSGVLKFDTTTEIVVPVKISDNAEIGNFLTILSSLDCAPYIIDKSFIFRVGKIRENFEAASFKVFPWINVNPRPWTITNTISYDGIMSARSGILPTSGGSSTLMIRTFYETADSIKFLYKVSSEADYDFLIFRLNGIEILKKSGEIPWTGTSFPVPAGQNKMEWIYFKDNSKNEGSDCAWVDLIDFSVTGSVRYVQRDIAVSELVAPVQNDNIGNELVKVKVRNIGHDTITGFFLAYTINNYSSPVRQYFDNKLLHYQDSVTVTFGTRANLSRYGTYELSVYGYDNNDDYQGNDTLRAVFKNSVIDEPLLVFPNPFTDQFRIVINTRVPDNVQVTLVNLSGIRVYSLEKELFEGENTIILNTKTLGLSSAPYYLNIKGQTFYKSIPVIKIRH